MTSIKGGMVSLLYRKRYPLLFLVDHMQHYAITNTRNPSHNHKLY
ncbi:hypothetical protein APHWI1_1532 [Anaplasma phagocytophilum str. ApWI1]|uniref:Uncharacterized protein n=2 Tax=Anaplasma phagocytophilum TaxID=948 RepID=A0A0F3PYR8_ANAPH|nr:hypothetical protein APHHGE2_0751 [Anaplasma phagocytophilum str. HGE2]KJV85428.1 hypothetical protein APHWI1_1532 [Anaplasma phagocytophilum str. ApWI1]KJZ98215.1 hypothetical protein APHDU1_1274 [Anaplasma phagocytophilum]